VAETNTELSIITCVRDEQEMANVQKFPLDRFPEVEHIVQEDETFSGCWATRDLSVSKASGRWLVWLDPYDRLPVESLEAALSILRGEGKGAEVVYGQLYHSSEAGDHVDLRPEYTYSGMWDALLVTHPFFHLRSTWERVGGYNWHLPVGGLYPYLSKILTEDSVVKKCPEIKYYWRRDHPNQLTRNKVETLSAFLEGMRVWRKAHRKNV
jgi:hypothetical protein